MDSYHPDYLYGFTNACVEQGIDADTTALLAKHAQHKDAIYNSPEYKEGFENVYIKNAVSPSAWMQFARGLGGVASGLGGMAGGAARGIGRGLLGAGKGLGNTAKFLTATPGRILGTANTAAAGTGAYFLKKWHDKAEENAPFNIYNPSFLGGSDGASGGGRRPADFVSAMDAHLINGSPITAGSSSNSARGNGLNLSSDILGRVKDYKKTISGANDRIAQLQSTIQSAAGSNDPAKVIAANQARSALKEFNTTRTQTQENLERLMGGIEHEQGLMHASARSAYDAATNQTEKLLPQLQSLQQQQDRSPTLWDKITGNTPESVNNKSTEIARRLQAIEAAKQQAKQRMDFQAVQ